MSGSGSRLLRERGIPVNINMERLKHNLLAIGAIANAGVQGYTRLAYSPEERAALEWLTERMRGLGMAVRQDRIGNVYGRLGAAEGRAIAIGSHLDTVPQGGLYDGALGVAAGLECLETWIEHGGEPKVPLELIAFVGEEANPLGGTFGSRAAAGLIARDEVLEDKLPEHAYTWEDIAESRIAPAAYHSFLELHIEQGAVLEQNGESIGVVTAIAGILRLAVRIIGKASHAGTTPMTLRQDALVDATRLIQVVNESAKAAGGDIVATVGEIHASPNLPSVVPGEVQLMIEIRGSTWESMEQVADQLREWMARTIRAEVSVAVEKRPNRMSDSVQASIAEACEQLGVSYRRMYSGANHDANSMTAITDVGMIFVPSVDGLSHHPDEFTSWTDIEVGANVMLRTLQLTEKRLAER